MKFCISGETPSKKNSRINTRSGRSFPNRRYVKWHDNAINELRTAMNENKWKPVFEGEKIELSLVFYHGDLRRRDSDNQLSSVLDTLIDARIIPDDNWQVVPRKIVLDEYEKGNPHCIVEIKKI